MDSDIEKKVLIAEDDAMSRKLFGAFLVQCHARVSYASNGKEVVKMVQEHNSYDCIFLDLHMREMDGWETVRWLRTRGISYPIYAMTGDWAPNLKKELCDAGFSDVIFKPYDMQEISDLLKKTEQ